jgi:hypothetical protein
MASYTNSDVVQMHKHFVRGFGGALIDIDNAPPESGIRESLIARHGLLVAAIGFMENVDKDKAIMIAQLVTLMKFFPPATLSESDKKKEETTTPLVGGRRGKPGAKKRH